MFPKNPHQPPPQKKRKSGQQNNVKEKTITFASCKLWNMFFSKGKFEGCTLNCVRVTFCKKSWESKGTPNATPPMPPPQEITPYLWIIDHHN